MSRPQNQGDEIEGALLPREGMGRSEPGGIAHAVRKGGRMRLETASEVLRLIELKTDFVAWLTIEVQTPMMLKTINNEDDARETLRRLTPAPEKA